MFQIVARYSPPPPPGVAPPPQWGNKSVIRERLGGAVRDIAFESGTMLAPAMSPQHFRTFTERTAGPLVKLVEMLSSADSAKLAELRREEDLLAAEYFRDNAVHQEYLMTRAIKN